MPKEAPVLHLATRQPRTTSPAFSTIPTRQPAGAKPDVQIQHELQEVIQRVMGTPLAPGMPLMQVLPSYPCPGVTRPSDAGFLVHTQQFMC